MKDFFGNMLKWGTPECGIMCAVIGAVCAVLILTIGFWKMVLVAAFCAAGAFIGGVKDKLGFIKAFLNKVIPEPDRREED